MRLSILRSESESLISGVVDDVLQVLRVDGVQDVEEVLSVWGFRVYIRILEVDVERGIVF